MPPIGGINEEFYLEKGGKKTVFPHCLRIPIIINKVEYIQIGYLSDHVIFVLLKQGRREENKYKRSNSGWKLYRLMWLYNEEAYHSTIRMILLLFRNLPQGYKPQI